MRIEPVFLFDLDGTLIDSVYQHVLAWKEALDQEGIELAIWRIHRRIGMSGGLFTNQLLRETGLDISVERVERLRRRHAAAYLKYAGDVRPLPGARELLAWLSDAQIPWAGSMSCSNRARFGSTRIRPTCCFTLTRLRGGGDRLSIDHKRNTNQSGRLFNLRSA